MRESLRPQSENDQALLSDYRWRHYLAAAILALIVGIAFLSPPGFGDEFTYWSLAFDLHEIGGHAWSEHSFHDLRWPIWGTLWLWQTLFGAGLASFYCEPILFLVAATALTLTFGRIVFRSFSGAWVCAVAVLFAPVLNSVVYRPMPDLSEGVFGTCALLAWWKMMREPRIGRAAIFGVLSGLGIALAASNRITGIFITPVLFVATLVFYPRRWKWLALPALAAAAFFAAECAVYYAICGDWLHSIHANLSGRQAKDVEVMPLWRLPIRYCSGFFRGDRLAPIYGGLMMIGIWAGWRRWGREGRLVVIWFAVLYLEYSCAIQSLHPIRPLIGSTFRYLATLAMPQCLLVGIGAFEVCTLALTRNWRWLNPVAKGFTRAPILAGSAVILLLALVSSRPFFDLGFIPPLRHYMAEIPAGLKIFSHHGMYNAACLADAKMAHRFTWVAPKHILRLDAELEPQAVACDQLWTVRKLLWMNERKEVEHFLPRVQPKLGTYIADPERDWILVNVIPKDDEPAFVFYRRRMPDSSAPRVLTTANTELQPLLPKLPTEWSASRNRRIVNTDWKVPASLRGKLVNLEFQAASGGVEPMTVKLRFSSKSGLETKYELRPILYAGGGEDHFALAIPAEAENCAVEAKFTRKTDQVQLLDFRLVYDEAR